jgi:hypothetical protein
MPEMRSSEGHLLILSYEEQPAVIGCGLYLQPAGIMNMWVFSR